MKHLIVANWKMNPSTLAEAKRLFNSVRRGVKNIKNVEIIICPPVIYLSGFRFQVSGFRFGAQDCFWQEKGAFTGEISPLMLKDIGCQYVIIGHSERRQCFGETDETVNKKLRAAILAGLVPILCIGENQEQRDKGEALKILKNQLISAFKDIPSSKFSLSHLPPGCRPPKAAQGQAPRANVAYEPIWAVGSGKPCSAHEVKAIVLFLRRELTKILGQDLAKKIFILYGGSVNSQNAASYIKEGQANGLLVGSASLQSKEFIELIKAVDA